MLRHIFYSLAVAAFVLSAFIFTHEASAAEEDISVPEAALSEDLFLFDDSLTVTDENLGEMRGTALDPEVLGIAIFDALSANNTSNGTVSGGNIIDAGAFSDSSGLSTVIQNSGNNVVIQSATILNLNIE